ncbi:MAG: metalloregulator ArsR/SmtB family transcription factor [Bacteroidota bacterium]|nr:metalloregulator ArsR/SmtB family transcription factor [Bacteroidota bacterium]
MDNAANKLKAVAHPLRIAIIEMLEPEGTRLSVTEIDTRLRMDQATASHHLRILKDKGILGSIRSGKNIHYYLKLNVLLQILDCLEKCTH